MDFSFTKEQEMIRDMVRDIANNVIKPRAIEIDQKANFQKIFSIKWVNLAY